MKKEAGAYKKLSALCMAARLLKMVSPLGWTMLLSTLAGILGNLAAIGLMVGGGALLCAAAGFDTGLGVGGWSAVLLLCALLRGLFRYVEQYYGHDVAFRLLALLREKIFTALRRLAPAKLLDRRSGDLNAVIIADVEMIEVFFAHTISPVLIAGAVSLIMLVFTAQFGWIFPLVLGAFYLLTVLLGFASVQRGKMSGREYRQQFAESASHLLDSIRGMKEILILGRQEASLRQINENGKKLNDCLGRLSIHKSIAVALPEMLIALAVMTTFCLALSWRLPLDRMIILLAAVASSFGPVTALSALSVDLLNVFAAAGRIFKILDEEPAVEDGDQSEDLVCGGSVGFADVHFCYPDSDAPVLRQFSLTAQPGEKIALIGPSGCGKSTALRLLLRYFDPQQGRISLSGRDIRRLPLKTLRRHVAMLTQDVFLFDESIAYNIKLGNPGASEEQVKAAARCALIDDFIEGLPQGYRTRVGELGDRLSGGEKQRIGIARVLLSGARVIALDEPTSNLDALNEKGILAILKKEFADRTLLMVSHRLAAVQWADRIHRVTKGVIQESKPQDLAT